MNNEEISLGEMLNNSNNNFFYEKKNFINELEPETFVEIQGKLVSKKIQNTKNGKNFLLLTLEDKTGSLRGIDWFNPDKNNNINLGEIIKVKGKIVIFDSRLQINIDKNVDSIEKVPYENIEENKFLIDKKINIDELINSLKKSIENVKNDDLKIFLNKIFFESNLSKKFQNSPAAMSIHHAYKHGLLEHSLNVLSLSLKICDNYNYNIDKDILIAGSLLHDIGKINEYKITKSGIEKTELGEMIGHMNLGITILEPYTNLINEDTKNHIYHIILSHHGELEYGSPILPKTIEAMIIHFSDNIDSKLSQIKETIKETKNENPDSKWTNFEKRFGRKFKI